MRFFDAHCHLHDERLAGDLAGALTRARAAGIARWSCCAAEEEDWPAVLALAAREPGVTPSCGCHPWYLGGRREGWLERLEALVAVGSCAVGECGLDHGLEVRDDAEQERAFLAQLDLARRRRVPVSIHCRRAFDRLVACLKDVGDLPAGFVVHAYSGTPELIEPLAARGGYFSFSGTLTYHRNTRAHRNVKAVPRDRLLLETDAPDMLPLPESPAPGAEPAPRAERPPPNQPENLLLVARAAARLLGWELAEVALVTDANARRLFDGGAGRTGEEEEEKEKRGRS